MLPRSLFSNVIGNSSNEDIIEEDHGSDSEISNNSSEMLDLDTTPENEDPCSPQNKKIADRDYIYTASTLLNYGDINSIPSTYETVVVLLYKVNTEGKVPFLEFGLTYDFQNRECDFMRIPRNQLSELASKSSSAGYMLYSNTLSSDFAFVFIPMDNYQPELKQMLSLIIPTLQFVVADEIMNLQHVFGFPISETVTEFFADNRHFLFLHDTKYNMYETPCIGYAGIEKSNADFTQVFGIDRSDATAPFGTGFYFTSFAKAQQNAIEPVYDYLSPCLLNKSGEKRNGVVSRFILFLRNMKVISNHPDDDIDESDIKTCMLNKVETRKIAKSTMRITDHDGKWQNNFDSVFIGDLLLDDGTRLDMGPLYVIKEHNQQMCLDYKSTLLVNA